MEKGTRARVGGAERASECDGLLTWIARYSFSPFPSVAPSARGAREVATLRRVSLCAANTEENPHRSTRRPRRWEKPGGTARSGCELPFQKPTESFGGYFAIRNVRRQTIKSDLFVSFVAFCANPFLSAEVKAAKVVDSITQPGTCQHDLCRLTREYIITPSLRDKEDKSRLA